MGIFDYPSVPLIELAADRREDIQILQNKIDAYRTINLMGTTPQDHDWEHFDRTLSEPGRQRILQRLETDEDGLAATFDFLGGDTIVALRPHHESEEEAAPQSSNLLINNKTVPLAEDLSGAYRSWNSAIAEAFFGSHNQDRAVYLSLEDHVLDQVALKIAVTRQPEESLYAAVRENLDLEAEPAGIFTRFDKAIADWRSQTPDRIPPHIALLAFFSRIALRMHEDDHYSATNYTARYITALGLAVDSLQGERAKNAYRRVANRYFQHLNTWLDDHDGRFGISTGYALDSRIHVGLPIAQSLVRDPDRVKLRDLFSYHDLRPGETMSNSDMERLLSDWILSSHVSDLLKRLWRRGSVVRRQIAAVASQELAAWQGVVRQDVVRGHVHERRVRVAASLGKFPQLKLHLGLVVPAGLDLAGQHLKPANDALNTAAVILNPVGGTLEIADQSLGDHTEVMNSAGLDFEAILQSRFSLQSDDLDGTLEWRPDPILILRRDAAVPGRYIQQRRADLGSQLMILVVNELAAEVSGYLAQVARPGFRSFTPQKLVGCPSGWTLFDRVLITDVANPDNQELLPLSPETHRTKISFEGGLRVSGGNRSVWHSSSPPEVTISAHNAPSAAFSVNFSATSDEDSENQELVPTTRFVGSTSVQLPALPVSGYVVVDLYEPENSRQPEQRTITLVTGASPRPRPSVSAGRVVGRDLGHTGTLKADQIALPTESIHLVGAKLVGAQPAVVTGDYSYPSTAGLSIREMESPPEESGQEVKTVNLNPSQIVSCFAGDNHHFILPEIDNTQGSGRSGRPSEFTLQPCKNCGRIKPHHQWPEHWTPRSTAISTASSEIAPLLTPNKLPIGEWKPADPDQMLDTLTYLGEGNWGSFQRLALQVNQDPNYPIDLARTLSSLGHIELEVDDNWSITSWSLAPKCLVFNSSGTAAFLTGARSAIDLEWLDSLAEYSGTDVFTSATGEGIPSQVGLTNLDTESIDRMRESAGEHIYEDLSLRIALTAQPLSEAITLLPPYEISEGVSAYKFNVQTLGWEEEVYRPGQIGAYRFGRWRRWYAFDDGDVLRRAEYQVVKHLAAKSEGRPLISYENKLDELRVPLGAELPGIYDRAATLASGVPASKHPDSPWVEVYREIPENLATAIFSQLYL